MLGDPTLNHTAGVLRLLSPTPPNTPVWLLLFLPTAPLPPHTCIPAHVVKKTHNNTAVLPLLPSLPCVLEGSLATTGVPLQFCQVPSGLRGGDVAREGGTGERERRREGGVTLISEGLSFAQDRTAGVAGPASEDRRVW